MTHKRVPSFQERLRQASALFRDGASQREVTRTTGIAGETLIKHYPGHGWTYKQGGEFRQIIRHSQLQLGSTP
jgi:hypothetical protein